jgi:hypothetical protein
MHKSRWFNQRLLALLCGKAGRRRDSNARPSAWKYHPAPGLSWTKTDYMALERQILFSLVDYD